MKDNKYQLVDAYDKFEDDELFEKFSFIRAFTFIYLSTVFIIALLIFLFLFFKVPELFSLGFYLKFLVQIASFVMLGCFLYLSFKEIFKRSNSHFLELKRSDDSEIFNLVDEVWDRAGMEKSYRLFVTPEVNAYAGLNYRLFRKSVPTISLGILLLKHFTKEELQSVIAHEIGHVKGEHSLKIKNARNIISVSKSLLKLIKFPGLSHLIVELDALLFSIFKRFELEADELEYELTKPEDVKGSFNKFCALKGCEDRAFDSLHGIFFDSSKHEKAIQLILDNISSLYRSDLRPLLAKINFHKSDFYNVFHPSYDIRLKRVNQDYGFSELDVMTDSLICEEKYSSFCSKINERIIGNWKECGEKGKKLRSDFEKLKAKENKSQEELWELYNIAVELSDQSTEEILRAYKYTYDDSRGSFDLALYDFKRGDFEKCIEILVKSRCIEDFYPPELYLLQLAYRCHGEKVLAKSYEHLCRDTEWKTGITPDIYTLSA